jgi:hypothetical protein
MPNIPTMPNVKTAAIPDGQNRQDRQPEDGPLVTRYVYEGGHFIPGDPLGFDAAADDSAVLSESYNLIQTVGREAGLHYTLHEKDHARGWVVFFGTGPFRCCIVVESWPDVIHLLRDLSGIVLGGLVSAGALGRHGMPPE